MVQMLSVSGLPAWLAERRPRRSARFWLVLAAALGAGACGYAGLYPRFDGGALRAVIGLTSMPFAGAVVAASLNARTPQKTIALAFGFSAILGMGSTVVPALLLSGGDLAQFFMVCLFGAVFGAMSGALYGAPLALLARLGRNHMRVSTHDGVDRAARLAGIWLSCIALVALGGTLILDARILREAPLSMGSFPATVAAAVGVAGAAIALAASLRLRRRAAWVGRVRAGLEPAFRLRRLDGRDVVDDLPRLAEGGTVVELVQRDPIGSVVGSAYRVSALGVAVALVGDNARDLA
jgi:hypothetical protein